MRASQFLIFHTSYVLVEREYTPCSLSFLIQLVLVAGVSGSISYHVVILIVVAVIDVTHRRTGLFTQRSDNKFD